MHHDAVDVARPPAQCSRGGVSRGLPVGDAASLATEVADSHDRGRGPVSQTPALVDMYEALERHTRGMRGWNYPWVPYPGRMGKPHGAAPKKPEYPMGR